MTSTSYRATRAALGVAALCAFAAALALTWMFLHGGFVSGRSVRAVFSSPGVGQQLPVGGDIKVRGVLVGSISDIVLSKSGNAVVEFRLDEGVELPSDTRAEIRSKTVFGQKWLELIPAPDSTATLLAKGSVIPDELTVEPVELERSLELGHELLSRIPLKDLTTVFRTLAEGFSGQEGDARNALDRGLVALRAVNSRADELDTSLRQLREFSGWLNENDANLLAFLDAFDRSNRALVGAAPEFTSSLGSVPVFLNHLASFQARNEGNLGRLAEGGATIAELLRDNRSDLVDIIVQLQAFTTVWNSGLRQPCDGPFEGDMTCWQVYQPPGLESRGLYGRGRAPAANEPGDPGLLRALAPPSSRADAREALEDALGRKASPRLVALLEAGMAEDARQDEAP
nr:MCE family protein [Actinomycetota bacterium]